MKKHPADGGDKEEVRLGKTRVTDEDMRDLESTSVLSVSVCSPADTYVFSSRQSVSRQYKIYILSTRSVSHKNLPTLFN